MPHSPELDESLRAVARAMAPARHDWWIITSAACALHGVDPGVIRDVDVLLDRRDVPQVLGALGVPFAPGEADGRFRSEIFAVWPAPALAVEFFAGFHLFEAGEWREIRPVTRIAVDLVGTTLFVPEQHELREILLRFGRPKDLARAALLSASGRSPSRSGNA